MFNLLFLGLGLLGGIAITYFLIKGKFAFGKDNITHVSSHTIVERIERVFKVVTAEGHFSEIYDYENTSHIFTLIPSTKKALVIVNAKVMMGFDFKKMKYEINETTKEINILAFPQPEILSIEPELKYYNLENGLFNKFDNKDLTQLQREAKVKISDSVKQSDLTQIAQHQIETLLLELADMSQYQLQGSTLIQHPNLSLIETKTNT